MHTGDKIRIIRDIKGLSQDNVAHDVGITRNAYGDMERGKLGISEKRLEQIAKALGVTPKDIHNFDDKMANFFENCHQTSVVAGSTGNQLIVNNFDQQELMHQLEIAKLENEKFAEVTAAQKATIAAKDEVITAQNTTIEALKLALVGKAE